MTSAQLDNGVIVGQFAATGADAEHFSVVLDKDSPLTPCVNAAIEAITENGKLAADHAGSGSPTRRTRPLPALIHGPATRPSRWRGRISRPDDRRRPRVGAGAERHGDPCSIAVFSTVIVFGVIALVVVNAPGWPRGPGDLLQRADLLGSLPKLLPAFWMNVQLFLIAEVLILVFALVLARDAQPARARSSSRSG